jgi:5'-nucleotidase
MHRRLVAIALSAVLAGTFALTAAPASAGKNAPKPIRILVTNDDGVAGAGTDALVEALRKVKGVKVTVIAPAENKSGTGSSTTPGVLTTTETTLPSGYPATAVAGFPADSVVYALDQGGMKQPPHLVISGINQGQNLGAIADAVSGTVGAAKAAALRGVPALAASQGLLENGEPDYASGVKEVLRWLKQHRKALTRKPADIEVTLENLNVPTCVAGAKNRGLVDVPLAPEGTEGVIAQQDCASTLEDPSDDIVAFNNGFVTLTELPVPTA